MIDNRPKTRSDTLWDGTHLYVALARTGQFVPSATVGQPARLYRYSYNHTTRAYTLDAGFPVQINKLLHRDADHRQGLHRRAVDDLGAGRADLRELHNRR